MEETQATGKGRRLDLVWCVDSIRKRGSAVRSCDRVQSTAIAGAGCVRWSSQSSTGATPHPMASLPVRLARVSAAARGPAFISLHYLNPTIPNKMQLVSSC